MDFPIKTTLVFKSSIFIAWLDYSRFVNPQVSTTISLYRNINLLSIGYSAGWRTYLRSRLTPHRRPLCGKPWVFGVRHSQPDFVTHSGILTSINSSPIYIVTFSANGTLPYHNSRLNFVYEDLCKSARNPRKSKPWFAQIWNGFSRILYEQSIAPSYLEFRRLA